MHSYGKCLHNTDEPPKAKGVSPNESKRKILSKYKFYLSFENAKVGDYVSEKVFDGILAGTLSIYWGAPSIHKLLPGDGAILSAEGVEPEALAETLKTLAADEALYNKHFEWKRERSPTAMDRFQTIIDMTAYKFTALCRTCAMLAGGGEL